MRAVLYAEDMEPITVLELNDFCVQYLRERGEVRIPVMEPVRWMRESDNPGGIEFRAVLIISEILVRKGERHMLLFTGDEESALLLRSAFLPGQYSAVQERERMAMVKGFLRGVQTFRP